jgi:hypothetical protein
MLPMLLLLMRHFGLPPAHLQLLLLLAVQPCNGRDGGSVKARVAQLQPPQLSSSLPLTQLLILQLVLQQRLQESEAQQHQVHDVGLVRTAEQRNEQKGSCMQC